MNDRASLGEFLQYSVAALALVATGFTIGGCWSSRYRPSLQRHSHQRLDENWECHDAGNLSALIADLNRDQPKPENILPIYGHPYRVWYRKDGSGFKYELAKHTSRDYTSRQILMDFMNDSKKVVLGFGGKAPDTHLDYLQVSPPAAK